jgi:hypothetical protein
VLRGRVTLKQPHPHASAEEPAWGSMASAEPTPKAVALVLVPETLLMLAFAFLYAAFHDPAPAQRAGAEDEPRTPRADIKAGLRRPAWTPYIRQCQGCRSYHVLDRLWATKRREPFV